MSAPSSGSAAVPAAPRALPGVLAYLASYVALDWISLIHPIGGVGITPWSPQIGLTFALLLRHGWRFAVAAFGAVTLADLLLHGLSEAPLAAAASALVVALGYGGAAWLLRRRLGFTTALTGSRDLVLLLAVAVAATMSVAGLAVLVLAGAGVIGWPAFWAAVARFWVGDMIGIAVLTPFLLLLFAAYDRGGFLARPGVAAVVETSLQAAAIGLGLWLIFGIETTDHFELSYVLFLPLVWIALRHGLPGATWGVVATQLGLILAIQLKGHDAEVVTQFQLLMLAVAATGLFLGGVVDERRRAEALLRDSEARLQIVVGTAPDAILTLEEDGTIASANRAAERLFGFGPKPPAGLSLRRLVPALEGNGLGRTEGVELTAHRLDGGSFVAEVSIGEARIGERAVRVAIVRDVSARREAEARLEERESELAHAARLTTTGEMAAALAHEVNQPLTALIGFARACQAVLQSPAATGEEARRRAGELIDQAVQQAVRAGEIIRRAREFFRRGDVRRERIEVADVFRAVLDLSRAQALQRRVHVVVRLDDALPPLLVDPIQVEQAMLNLVRNAIEAIVHSDPERREVELRAAPAPGRPDYLEVAVRDSGPGVPPEIAEKLFTPFTTTKDAGIGLGLSIVRSIVESHGGRIWLAPAGPGDGADFRFTLPFWSDEAGDA